MKLNLSFLIFVLIFFRVSTFAQNSNTIPCYTDQYYQKLLNANPVLKSLVEQRINADDETFLLNPPPPTRAVRVIPIVFHIIHQYGNEDVPDASVYGLVRQLNEDMSLKNSDLNTARAQYQSLAANMQIEFRLARIDPDGKCTNGINRVVSPLTIDADDQVKSLIWWDNTKYLNVWVVRSINSTGSTGIVLGYSYYPWLSDQNPNNDGIVMVASEVGYGSANRTLTHEVGHYLGLYHTFEGGCTATSSMFQVL